MSEENEFNRDELMAFPFEKQIRFFQEVMRLIEDLKSNEQLPVIISGCLRLFANFEALRIALKAATPGASIDAVLALLPKLQDELEKLSEAFQGLVADIKDKHPEIVKLAAELPKVEE